MIRTNDLPVAEAIVALERSAIERWNRGDVDGCLEIYADDVSYFDPVTEKRLDGRQALLRPGEPEDGGEASPGDHVAQQRQRHRVRLADRDARQAPGRGLVDGHNHDLITSFQEGQRLALDSPGALERERTITGSISGMLRYIETF